MPHSLRERIGVRHLAGTALLCSLAALAGCKGSGNDDASSVQAARNYSLGATISGLSSPGLVLAVDVRQRPAFYLFAIGNNLTAGVDNATMVRVSAGVTTQALASLTVGSDYSVAVQSQPVGETCSVNGGTGVMQAASLTVSIACAMNSYTVGGTISGLSANGLVVLDNGGDPTPVSAGTTQFSFNSPVRYGGTYTVTIQQSPTGLLCSVSQGTGVVSAADVTSVNISCASNFSLLYSFAGGSDGADPYHSLIQGSDGNFYGTTLSGGTHNGGTVFRVSASGTESILYSFAAAPFAGLIQGGDGNFYGTTANGGTAGRGTVFELTPSGTQTVLFSFPAGSSDPYTGLTEGTDGLGAPAPAAVATTGRCFRSPPRGLRRSCTCSPRAAATARSRMRV